MKIKVFVETDAGSQEKNIYNEETLEFRKVMQVSREYPYPYGFIVDTTGGDGDNIDCFILTNKSLKPGETYTCEPIGLMEQIETSWDPSKKGVEEEDHNVLAVLEGESVILGAEVKEKLTDFVSHVFDHVEGKKVRVGAFLSKEDAMDYLVANRD